MFDNIFILLKKIKIKISLRGLIMGRTSIITGVRNGSPLLSPVIGLKMSCPSILTNQKNLSVFLCCDWPKATGIAQAHALFGQT